MNRSGEDAVCGGLVGVAFDRHPHTAVGVEESGSLDPGPRDEVIQAMTNQEKEPVIATRRIQSTAGGVGRR